MNCPDLSAREEEKDFFPFPFPLMCASENLKTKSYHNWTTVNQRKTIKTHI